MEDKVCRSFHTSGEDAGFSETEEEPGSEEAAVILDCYL